MYPFFFLFSFFFRKSGEQKIALNAVYANRVQATFGGGFERILVRFVHMRLSPDALPSQIEVFCITQKCLLHHSQCDNSQQQQCNDPQI